MRKRVLFCIENFQHGGINKSLENIVSLIDKEKYDVVVFAVNSEDGPYKKIFKPFLRYDEDPILRLCCTYLHKSRGLRKLGLIVFKSLRKFLATCGVDPFYLCLSKWTRKFSEDNYDCVVAFSEGYVTTKFISHVKGHKVAWIHIDYERYLSYSGGEFEENEYSRYDDIVIPSNFSAKSFCNIYPALGNRVRVIPNLIDTTSVKNKALAIEELASLYSDSRHFRLLSVGRICYEKRFFEIPAIAKRLKDRGLVFKWYIIGDGSQVEASFLDQAIFDNNVQDCVILLGRKDNPYPFIANSDLLVSTSLSETFSYVVFEAKILGTPVVCADFGTASEILNDREGRITSLENMDGIIYKLLSEKGILAGIRETLAEFEYDNHSILQKIYSVIDN